MLSSVSPGDYEVLRPIIGAVYLLWAASWSLVAWHYGTAARASWLASSGRWRDVVGDICAPFVWGLRNMFCRLRLMSGTSFCAVPFPDKYTSGHILRFAVFLGSLSPMLLGFGYFSMNRGGWDYWQFVVGLVSTLISTLSAATHLYIAYRSRPAAWGVISSLAIVWLGLGPLLLYVLI